MGEPAHNWKNVSMRARRYLSPMLPMPCTKCGRDVYPDDKWDVDHVPPRVQLTQAEIEDPAHWFVAHTGCNRSAGARMGAAMRRARSNAGSNGRAPSLGREEDSRRVQSSDTPRGHLRALPEARRTDGERPGWWPEVLGTPPDGAVVPRLETPHHSLAVGTYGPLVRAYAESELGVSLRWWQFYAVSRILEHDAEGRLLWAEAAVSVARQVGKGFGGIRPLCEWRTSPEAVALFGEPQTVLHVAHQVNTVMEIAMPAIARARDLGHRVRLTNGEQMIQRPDSSRWLMRSTTGAYGFSVNMPVVDEIWAVHPRVIDSMIVPTMTERSQPQLVMFSTANASPTSTYSAFRAASGEDDSRLLVEWSAPEEARRDYANRRYWRMASPHWSDQRERIMARQVEKASAADFCANWLNMWPLDVATTSDRPLSRWDSLAVAQPPPARGGIAAIDEFRDGSRFAMVLHVGDSVWYYEDEDLRRLVVRANLADHVIVGLTIVDPVIKAGLRHKVLRWGAKETRQSTPLLVLSVRSGRLSHNHDASMSEQAGGAVLHSGETGDTLSSRRSEFDVTGPKLVAWCLLFARNHSDVRPQIWS